jgi:hypothetical protein
MKRNVLPLFLAPAMLICGATAAERTDMGYLKVKVTPDKAGVFLDGQYYGPAARFASTRKYLVAPGKHEITLVDPRYEDASATVQIEAGKTAIVTETMKAKPEPKPPFGTLRIVCSYKLAAVMLNDRYVGHVDEFNNGMQGLLLNPGAYFVRIDLSDGQSLLSEQVAVEADKTTVVRWD